MSLKYCPFIDWKAPPTAGGGAGTAMTLENRSFNCSKRLNVVKSELETDQTGFETLLLADEDRFWASETRLSQTSDLKRRRSARACWLTVQPRLQRLLLKQNRKKASECNLQQIS